MGKLAKYSGISGAFQGLLSVGQAARQDQQREEDWMRQKWLLERQIEARRSEREDEQLHGMEVMDVRDEQTRGQMGYGSELRKGEQILGGEIQSGLMAQTHKAQEDMAVLQGGIQQNLQDDRLMHQTARDTWGHLMRLEEIREEWANRLLSIPPGDIPETMETTGYIALGGRAGGQEGEQGVWAQTVRLDEVGDTLINEGDYMFFSRGLLSQGGEPGTPEMRTEIDSRWAEIGPQMESMWRTNPPQTRQDMVGYYNLFRSYFFDLGGFPGQPLNELMSFPVNLDRDIVLERAKR